MKTTLARTHVKLGITIAMSLLASQLAYAATQATIDLKTQKFIGGISDLDRGKYFNIHMTPLENKVTQAELNYLVNDLNVGFGRQFWSPFSVHSGDAPYPSAASAQSAGSNNISSIKNHASYPYYSKNMIVTEHPNKIFVFNEDPNLGAEWAANYFKHYFDNQTRPKFYEPINEPFVHAGEFNSDQAAVRTQMTELFKAIGQKFDQQNIDTKVIGYSSAWPSMELWDFGHFNGRMKMFMDEAGPYIDSFSVHPYDGINVTGASNERSGSNLESILDLLETYSYVKWDTVKPVTISEYGGIEEGYGNTYSDIRSAQSLASQNKMLMQLLNRQDRLLTSIPFNTGKAAWHYNAANNWNPYGAAVLRPDPNSIVNGEPTNFFWTKRVDFYRLWSNVKGKRVKVESNNPDIQLNAFVDGNKAYVAINTLADYWETVNLDFANSLGNITNVRKKRLVVRKNAAPIYQDVSASLPTSYSMEPGETIIFELTFSNNIAFDNTYNTAHYYAPQHLVAINANQSNSFTFNGVNVAAGQSVLRLSMGRVHGKSFQPTVTVNGSPVQINLNWAGGSQSSRDEFFGVIEVPVDNSLLQANNTVNITFPDAGGRIASVVLQVNNDSEVGSAGIQPPSTYTTVTFNSSGKCLDNTAGDLNDGNQQQQWGCYGSGNQLFLFESRAGGYWGLRNQVSGKCIDKTNSTADGAIVTQWACSTSNDNQSFELIDLGAGFFQLKNKHSEKCLDLVGGINGTANGTKIRQATCSNSLSQKLSF
ncbi:RICIN domain-containing protein [Catenovulum adriaticum]|uniref:RICIN domain-containing protein n=1 Tax=Catenovulum adriaticum TaxID=2984846 RepID=A0ABY7AUG4_9ALTE|nr:RICIN domain-containing protein [Catenovulum sp. TS8]WAJ72286.1 RICIN domain-containing protein [Catenovulum sp. TS8]